MKKQNLLKWIIGAAVAVLLLLSFGVFTKREGFQDAEGAPSFTMYYADWCPHCKSIKPEFLEFSKKKSINMDGTTVFLNMVEADTDAEKMKGKPVKGFPTFLFEKEDGSTVEYDGERNSQGWMQFIKANI